jgi:hypothetical protein
MIRITIMKIIITIIIIIIIIIISRLDALQAYDGCCSSIYCDLMFHFDDFSLDPFRWTVDLFDDEVMFASTSHDTRSHEYCCAAV